MTTIDREPVTKIEPIEIQSVNEVITSGKYNIQERYDYELNRFMRQIKFIVAGSAVGFTVGLLVGISYASRLAEYAAPSVPLIAASSMAVTGLILGAVGGFVAEQITAPQMTSRK